MEKIGVGYALVTEAEKRYVNEALNASRLSQGDMVSRFEKQFAALHSQKYGIACNSGTSALHVALEALKEKFNWNTKKTGGGYSSGHSSGDNIYCHVERLFARGA